MNRNLRSRLFLALGALGLGLVSLFHTGCTSVQVGENAYGEARLGELVVQVEVDFDRAYKAAKKAIEGDKLFLTGDERTFQAAVLNARNKADSLVTVKIKQVGDNLTSVKIRYGIPGDIAQAQMLYKKIEKAL